MVVGQASANIDARTNGLGESVVLVPLGRTSSNKVLRDKYGNLASYCGQEAKRMPVVRKCVESDKNFTGDCFAVPIK